MGGKLSNVAERDGRELVVSINGNGELALALCLLGVKEEVFGVEASTGNACQRALDGKKLKRKWR